MSETTLTTEQKVDAIIRFLEHLYGPNLVEPPKPLRPKPAEGFIKEGGWGANKDPDTWTVIAMKDDPRLQKVVDDKSKNVATHFSSLETASYYIQYHKTVDEQEPTAPEPPAPEAPAEKPAEGTSIKGPYPSTGGELRSTQRGPTTRNYASDKASDETIEKNVKAIKARNHQFIVYVTMQDMEHDDTISTKLGGTHMGTGWFDHSVRVYNGETGLGYEPDHPETHLFIKKGAKIGDTRKKKVGICAVYFADPNFTELWTDVGDGWKKQLEGKDIGGFNPKAKEFECQLRIDGFKKGSVPEIHTAVVQPIAAKN